MANKADARASTYDDIMTNKARFLFILAVVLGGAYAYWFTAWINVPKIEIIKSDRPGRRGRDNSTVMPIAFAFDGRYALTSVKVYRVNGEKLDPKAKPLWQLVGKPRSEVIKGFIYGYPIRGMQAAANSGAPDPLEPDVPYRLLVEAGRARGQIDFTAKALPGA